MVDNYADPDHPPIDTGVLIEAGTPSLGGEGEGNQEQESREDRPTIDLSPLAQEADHDIPSPTEAGIRTPGTTATAQALKELRQWFKEEQERKELQRLSALRRRYELGDPSALQEAIGTAERPIVAHQATERPTLPRPEPPHRYEKKNRADYNRWLRDNEDYHAKNPIYFQADAQKVAFGLQYTGESVRTLWETHVAQMRLHDPLWAPTWHDLKEKMLGALGTPEERKQAAYDAIKGCRQKPSQSPTDLLNYIQPLWVEIGELSPYRMVAEFTGALLEEVRRELRHLPQQSRLTLSQVEQEANRIYRDLVQDGTIKRGSGGSKRRSNTPTNTSPPTKDWKKAKGANKGPPKPKVAHEQVDKPRGGIECYACGDPGHIAPRCPKTAKRDAYFAKKKEGKDKGQRN